MNFKPGDKFFMRIFTYVDTDSYGCVRIKSKNGTISGYNYQTKDFKKVTFYETKLGKVLYK